ncbi:MAG: c-type cytochrome [Thiotrichales bacterium]|nr:MAG: c-type cytochrome [Thiotrichales bacterium]
MLWCWFDSISRIELQRNSTALLCLLFLFVGSANKPALADNTDASGRKVYDFYCYQCHGYSGDARTLATTYLEPPPRNFTQADAESLTRARMVDAVTHGRPGTAMVSFTTVISSSEIEAVVAYIRDSFMQEDRPELIYHTVENGWGNHDQYATAFPFANGSLPLDTPWEQLDADQKRGKRLFMEACITCHDRAIVRNEGPVWELRALSYPRKHYSHRMDMDSISSASPYLQHEQQPDTSLLSAAELRGAALFQQNCAFCHGADGTGRNWIGSFLEPHARDLTTTAIIHQATERLEQVIRNGLEGTSMPAWKHVLNDRQITDVVSYLKRNQTTARP